MSVGDILERDEDRPAFVRFEKRAVKDNEATLMKGYYVSRDEDYALITPPYSKDCVEKKVSTWFAQTEKNVNSGRIPIRHFEFWKESYKRWCDGQEPPVDGTSVKDWSSISPAQCDNLIRAGCRTIEDLAQANDEAMRRLGMGANDLKNKARAWVQAAKDHGPLTMEVASLRKENDVLKGSIDSLQEQIKLMAIQIEGKNVSHETPVQERILNDIADSTDYRQAPAELSLTSQYEAKFGKKPHHLLKDASILERIQRDKP